jgi:hypothetical protein
MESCRASATVISPGCSSHIRVLDSMSVNRIVCIASEIYGGDEPIPIAAEHQNIVVSRCTEK